MSRNRAPLTDADRAHIPADADALWAHIHAHGHRNRGGSLILLSRPIPLSRKLDMTTRRLARATQALIEEGAIRATPLRPRNDEEAAMPPMRLWQVQGPRADA